jgi:hypothetical protein
VQKCPPGFWGRKTYGSSNRSGLPESEDRIVEKASLSMVMVMVMVHDHNGAGWGRRGEWTSLQAFG